MGKISHPYLLTAAITILMVFGTIVVETHAPVARSGVVNQWETLDNKSPHTIVLDNSDPQLPHDGKLENTSTDFLETVNANKTTYFGDIHDTKTIIATKIIHTDTSFDFNAFMKQLSQSPQKKIVFSTPQETYFSTPEDTTFQVFPVRPAAVIATTPPRTAIQEALYTYGNAAGAYIQFYEQTHRNDAVIVENYYHARDSVKNAAALEQLGTDIKGVGLSLQKIQGIPTQAAAIHEALAGSYVDVGEKLITQTSTQNNADIIKAIGVYHDAVGIYIKNYVALVLIFSNNGVVFESSDPGSVFMFTNAHI